MRSPLGRTAAGLARRLVPRGEPGSALPLSKACELADFRDPSLRHVLREVFSHEVGRFGEQYPDGVEYRKHWETAMAVRAMRDLGALRPDAELLSVGAGNEPAMYWFTDHVKRVYATDLYLSEGWEESANASMMIDPGRYWPRPWNPRRLVVQHMDGRDLQYEDHCFDGIFSSSSIEHFGDHDDVRRSIREMHRVLRPGGVLSVSTELRITGPGQGLPGILMFDRAELLDVVVGAADWTMPGGLLTDVDAPTLATAQPFLPAAAEVQAHVAEHGGIHFHELDWARYPHIVLDEAGYRWTSVHLALVKPR